MKGEIIKIKRDFKRNKILYLMFLPILAFYVIFHYGPMYGVQIAFKDFSPGLGILRSPWVGLKYFIEFFDSYHFRRVVRNTLLLNFYDLLFGFPGPILLALLLNEVRNSLFKKTVQTVSYLPHFISTIVICGIIMDFVSYKGLINDIIALFGGERVPLLSKPQYFRTIFVGSSIWQGIGWGSIIYFAAISSVDPELYQAALIDGAGRLKQALHITIPSIMPTIIILFILNMGKMMSVNYEKIILLYNPSIFETADVISSYVYRKGIVEMKLSFSSAVGLFNSLINFCLLVASNYLIRTFSDTSLW